MDLQRLAGILLLFGFVLILSGFALSPPDLYQQTEAEAQLRIVEKNRSLFNVSMIASLAGIAVVAAGQVLLAVLLKDRPTRLLATAGAAAFVVSAVSIILAIFPGLIDPKSFVESAGRSAWTAVFAWDTIAAILLFGLVYLREGFPNWLGYLSVGAAVLAAFGVLFVDVAVVELLFLIPPLVGVMLLRLPHFDSRTNRHGSAMI